MPAREEQAPELRATVSGAHKTLASFATPRLTASGVILPYAPTLYQSNQTPIQVRLEMMLRAGLIRTRRC